MIKLEFKFAVRNAARAVDQALVQINVFTSASITFT